MRRNDGISRGASLWRVLGLAAEALNFGVQNAERISVNRWCTYLVHSIDLQLYSGSNIFDCFVSDIVYRENFRRGCGEAKCVAAALAFNLAPMQLAVRPLGFNPASVQLTARGVTIVAKIFNTVQPC